jgi:hypothetical protein
MYRFLGTHIYPAGETYYGPATQCQYSFYAAKGFDISQVYDHIIENSDIAAGQENATMLVNKIWVDETGANNRFTVRFDACGPQLTTQISGISFAIPAWVGWVILACVVFGFSAYIVNQIKHISYSPAGKEFWGAIKWLGIGLCVVVAIPLVSRALPKRATK